MKAAVLTTPNAPLEIWDVESAPLGFGQVLVKILAAGICGAQLQEIRGEKGGPLPHLMGHEGAALVQAIGPGVTRVKVGDKVVCHWRPGAGIESDFPRYRADGREFTSGLITTWAEQTVCSENRLTPVPMETDNTVAVLLGCSVSTALATVESEARWGERVLVIGCGGLGLALLGALEMVEPRKLCACDIREEKRFAAECAGADFVNFAQGEKLSGEFDLIIDTAGAPPVMENALGKLAPSGRYVMVGQPPPGAPVCLAAARHMFEGNGKTIKATQGGGFKPHVDVPRYLHLAKSIMFDRLVTHVFRLEEINAALDLVKAGQAGRVIIEIGEKTQHLAAQEELRQEGHVSLLGPALKAA